MLRAQPKPDGVSLCDGSRAQFGDSEREPARFVYLGLGPAGKAGDPELEGPTG
jgi:hypothetical protein